MLRSKRQQDDLKRGVISTVSHQLKTPLTSVRMAIHLLLEEDLGGLTEKQAEVLIAAEEDAERLHRILEDLLDIGRIESGKAQHGFPAGVPSRFGLRRYGTFPECLPGLRRKHWS